MLLFSFTGKIYNIRNPQFIIGTSPLRYQFPAKIRICTINIVTYSRSKQQHSYIPIPFTMPQLEPSKYRTEQKHHFPGVSLAWHHTSEQETRKTKLRRQSRKRSHG